MNETTFQGSGSIAYIPVVVNAKPKPITNADRIRSMTDEELAEYLDGVCHALWQLFAEDSQKMWLDWLKQEYKECEEK